MAQFPATILNMLPAHASAPLTPHTDLSQRRPVRGRHVRWGRHKFLVGGNALVHGSQFDLVERDLLTQAQQVRRMTACPCRRGWPVPYCARRGLLARGEPFLGAGDEPWTSIARFTSGWMSPRPGTQWRWLKAPNKTGCGAFGGA